LVEQRHDRIVTILFQAPQHRIAFHLNSLRYYDQAPSLPEAARAPWLLWDGPPTSCSPRSSTW